jgi:hypothetical protein
LAGTAVYRRGLATCFPANTLRLDAAPTPAGSGHYGLAAHLPELRLLRLRWFPIAATHTHTLASTTDIRRWLDDILCNPDVIDLLLLCFCTGICEDLWQ